MSAVGVKPTVNVTSARSFGGVSQTKKGDAPTVHPLFHDISFELSKLNSYSLS